jgi:hypothetical protein
MPMSFIHALRYLRTSRVVMSKSCWPAHLMIVLTPQHIPSSRGQRKPWSSKTSPRVARPSSIRKHGHMHNGAEPERATPLATTRHDRFIPPLSRQRGASHPLGQRRIVAPLALAMARGPVGGEGARPPARGNGDAVAWRFTARLSGRMSRVDAPGGSRAPG